MVCKTFFPVVSDNSGVIFVSCFSFIKGTPRSVLLSIRSLRSAVRFSKGAISRGVLVRFRQKRSRFSGLQSNFQSTAVAVCDSGFNPIARRILGPVDISLKKDGFHKFVLLAKRVI
jgi:ribosomal protein L14